MSHPWPWLVLALLGAYHGLNPAMGWLFAMAHGLQEQRRSGVLWALLPIALGHGAAIATAILLLHFAQQIFPLPILKWGVAVFLFSVGFYRLFRVSHPKGSGMRVSGWDLTIWSFLMASAHGAGLMVVPVLLGGSMVGMAHAHGENLLADALPLSMIVILFAVLIHTAAMLLVAGILAFAFFEFYEKVGLKLLRHAWLNFDLLWAIALLAAGVSVLWL